MNVLVGYKKSNLDDRMLKQAANVVKTMGGKLYLLNSAVGGPDVPKSEFDDREKDLTQAKRSVELMGVECETHLSVRGLDPEEDLIEFAEENQVDLIVVGVRDRSKVGKFVMGSRSQRVILGAPCPVLTVK